MSKFSKLGLRRAAGAAAIASAAVVGLAGMGVGEAAGAPLPNGYKNATGIDGDPVELSQFQGSPLLIVNTASQCGFTPQYRGLEALHRDYADKGLRVLGFPCDQFGHQEPGDEEEIKNFCSLTYDVTFPVLAKVEVNGPGADPLFSDLKRAKPGLFGTQAIKWNFTKFLIGRDGRVIGRYAPSAKPASLEGDIERALAEPAG